MSILGELSLTSCQREALDILTGTSNVFLTGVAGSGKSHLIQHFLRGRDPERCPVLASTGAAAILVGGRTFHSFFGLGIMQGGYDVTVERAVANKRLVKRLEKAETLIVDEASMLPGLALRAAEEIARQAREDERPWGGLRVILVGDFAQLPPVNPHGQQRDWAFLDPAWRRSRFVPAVLRTIVRTQDPEFLEVLNQVRLGQVDEKVRAFLNTRAFMAKQVDESYEGTRLFSRRDATEKFNLERLAKLDGDIESFPTEYHGAEKQVEDLKRNAPVPEVLQLKPGALVMLRMNDPMGRWVNGTLGEVLEIDPCELTIELLDGREIAIEPVSFTLLDAEGKEVASARNFPVNLAYATTIHKSQGMTLDRILVDLRNLWEAGQAYVAMSRVRSADGLLVSGWTPSSIRTDAQVARFNAEIFNSESRSETRYYAEELPEDSFDPLRFP